MMLREGNCRTCRLSGADTALCLEQRGLAATWSGLRIAYAAGGDGESDTRVDLRNFAAFVRDPTALVTCLLLPHSCSVKLQMQVCSRRMALPALKILFFPTLLIAFQLACMHICCPTRHLTFADSHLQRPLI